MQGILAKWKQNKGLVTYFLYLDFQYLAINSTKFLIVGRFQIGHNSKYQNVPFVRELKERGYDRTNLPKILRVNKDKLTTLLQEPTRLTGEQYIILSHLLCIPLSEVINTLFRTPPQSPHYLKEDYSTNHHVEKIKAELATKLSKDQSEPK